MYSLDSCSTSWISEAPRLSRGRFYSLSTRGNVLLYDYPMMYLSSFLMTCICGISRFGQLGKAMPQTFLYTSHGPPTSELL